MTDFSTIKICHGCHQTFDIPLKFKRLDTQAETVASPCCKMSFEIKTRYLSENDVLAQQNSMALHYQTLSDRCKKLNSLALDILETCNEKIIEINTSIILHTQNHTTNLQCRECEKFQNQISDYGTLKIKILKTLRNEPFIQYQYL